MRYAVKFVHLATSALFGMAALGATTADAAPITVFSAVDAFATSASPRPNSNTAAASFAAAIGTSTLVTFEAAPLGSVASPLTISPGVTIVGSTSDVQNFVSGTPDSLFGYNTTSGGSVFVDVFGGSLTFNFTQGITAFGAYFAGVQFNNLTLTYNDGSPQQLSIPFPSGSGGVGFLGFTNAAPIYSLTINALNDIISVDDVRFASAVAVTPVPEPATLTLVGAGLLAGARRWRNSRRKA
jgi:hypothetical protein